MRFKILTAGFWRNIFGLKRSIREAPKELPELEHISFQKQPSIPAGQSLRIEEIEAEKIEIDEPAKTKAAGRNIRALVRSELNLEQNCVFTVSTYRNKSREVVRREVMPSGDIVERRVIVGRTADGAETGILTIHHFKVYLALIEFWEKAGKPVGDKVHFTTLRLMKRLEMKDSGEEYRRLKRWVRSLRQTPVTFINSFYTPGAAEHTDLADVTILNHLHLYERKDLGKQKKTRGYGEFRFDDHIVENLINNHVHPLRLDVIKSFTKHKDLAILLYTYIDRNIAFKDSYEIGLEKLFEHLDLSQGHVKHPSDRKRVLDPVLEELRGKELSTGFLSYAQIHKTADGNDYKLVCRKKPFVKRLREQQAPYQPELALPFGTAKSELTETRMEPDSELFTMLIAKGLTHKQVAKLVAEKSTEIIEKQIEYLPFRVSEYESQRKEINEAAILYDSINDNWNVPKSYIEAEKEKEREARRLERERIARLEQEERDRAEQERVELEAYKETLDPEERARLRERALEEIRNMQGIKEEFITEVLIEHQENEILREEMEKDGDF